MNKESRDIMKRRIKKSVIKNGIIFLGALILLIIVVSIIRTIMYHRTDKYKLKQLGYNDEEIKIIETMSSDNIKYILNNDYNELVDDFKNEKYFLDKNLETYLNYQKENSSLSLTTIVSIVNVGANNDWYTNTKETDLTKNELILVNKYHYLPQDYEPSDIIDVSLRYAYSDNKTSESILEHYKEMFNAASRDGITLIISSAYRTSEEQEETYNYYLKNKGEDYVKSHASLKRHSEHETGLAFDILTPNYNISNFDKSPAFEWLKNNSYKYGFIMRYPEGKENITGYEYEPWHYRYVGDVAKKIYDENITFDEYYAYYVEG